MPAMYKPRLEGHGPQRILKEILLPSCSKFGPKYLSLPKLKRNERSQHDIREETIRINIPPGHQAGNNVLAGLDVSFDTLIKPMVPSRNRHTSLSAFEDLPSLAHKPARFVNGFL